MRSSQVSESIDEVRLPWICKAASRGCGELLQAALPRSQLVVLNTDERLRVGGEDSLTQREELPFLLACSREGEPC